MIDDDQDGNTPRDHIATNSERHAHLQAARDAGVIADPVEQDLQLRVRSLEESRRAWRWIAGITLPVLLVAMTTVQLWMIDRVSTSERAAGRSEATTESIQFRLNLLEGYVHELLRHAGLISRGTVAVGGP
jgi:hypothetical protein